VDDDDLVLVDPWVDLRGGGLEEAKERERLLAELRAEVVDGHPLHGVDLVVVGRSYRQDDVLFALNDGRWAVVHLTFARPDRPPWPSTSFYDSVEALEAAVSDDM
jgi:hypothetical protein